MCCGWERARGWRRRAEHCLACDAHEDHCHAKGEQTIVAPIVPGLRFHVALPFRCVACRFECWNATPYAMPWSDLASHIPHGGLNQDGRANGQGALVQVEPGVMEQVALVARELHSEAVHGAGGVV